MKILISEDDDVSRYLLKRLLEKMGHDLILTADGLEALHAYKENDIDMAILDWMMPNMDGIELCMKIRELEKGANRPTYILMVTAKSEEIDIVHALEAGVDDFLTKPVDKKKLERRIQSGLLYQTLLKKENQSKQEPYLLLTEEHNVFRKLIHIFDVINEKLESGISEEALKWSISTLATLKIQIHIDKENQYFQSCIASMNTEHDDWFKDVSESSFLTITSEHAALDSGINALQGRIFDSQFDAKADISSLKASINEQTGLLLRHMYKEENYFLPFAQKYLHEEEQKRLLVTFEEIDSLFGKQLIDRKNKEVTELLNLVTENEDNITTWRPRN